MMFDLAELKQPVKVLEFVKLELEQEQPSVWHLEVLGWQVRKFFQNGMKIFNCSRLIHFGIPALKVLRTFIRSASTVKSKFLNLQEAFSLELAFLLLSTIIYEK